tara:strand:- start:1226 stop:1345 length:120 start_codon:yes stop_codon:yes gene_type:complete
MTTLFDTVNIRAFNTFTQTGVHFYVAITTKMHDMATYYL